MKRQYRSPQSDADELRIIELVYKKLGALSYKKLPPKCQADFALLGDGGTVIGIVEVKSRKTLPASQFQTYRISLNKLIALKQWAQMLPTYLVVEFSDSIRSWKITKQPNQSVEFMWSGRTDRNDPNDMEVMTGILMKTSKLLKRGRT